MATTNNGVPEPLKRDWALSSVCVCARNVRVGMRGPSSVRKECAHAHACAKCVRGMRMCVRVVLKNVYKLMPIFFEKRPLSQPVSQ
jgi:hypothetical protein